MHTTTSGFKFIMYFAHCIPQANAATVCTTYHFKSRHAPIVKAGCAFLEISEKCVCLYVCLCISLSFCSYSGKLLLKACEKLRLYRAIQVGKLSF